MVVLRTEWSLPEWYGRRHQPVSHPFILLTSSHEALLLILHSPADGSQTLDNYRTASEGSSGEGSIPGAVSGGTIISGNGGGGNGGSSSTQSENSSSTLSSASHESSTTEPTSSSETEIYSSTTATGGEAASTSAATTAASTAAATTAAGTAAASSTAPAIKNGAEKLGARLGFLSMLSMLFFQF
jgi:hypothetical protein